MKYTLKTLTALGLICSALNSAQAQKDIVKDDGGTLSEDYFSKCPQKSEQEAQEFMTHVNTFLKEMAKDSPLEEKSNWTDARKSLTFSRIDPHLNDIERRHISLLLDKAVVHMFGNEIQKYQKSLPSSEKEKKLPKTQYILGHLWISSVKYLSP